MAQFTHLKSMIASEPVVWKRHEGHILPQCFPYSAFRTVQREGPCLIGARYKYEVTGHGVFEMGEDETWPRYRDSHCEYEDN